MRRPVYWIIITLLLCLLLGYASAQGGHGGMAPSDSQEYSRGQSMESPAPGPDSPAQDGGLSGASGVDMISRDESGSIQGSETGPAVPGPGGSDGSAIDSDPYLTGTAPDYRAPSGVEPPNDPLTGGGSGNSGGASDDPGPLSSPGVSRGTNNQGDLARASPQAPGPMGGGDRTLPDPREQERTSPSGREEAGFLQNSDRQGPSTLKGTGMMLEPGGGRGSMTTANRMTRSYPSEGSDMVPGQMHGALGLFAASSGGVGMTRGGSEGPRGHSSAVPSPEAHGPHRQQQGMPVQYPCGPAQSTPVIPDQGSKSADAREDTHPKARSKRTRMYFTEEGPVQFPVSTPSSSRIPLFPFSLLLFGGYKRISKRNVLEHDTRQNVFSAISSNPGIDVPMLARTTGINENTLRYHLVKLIESGRITYLVKPGVIRYFLNQGSYSPTEQVLVHYLWSETPRAILHLLYSARGLTRQQISDALGISGPSVTRHMEHLIDDGIIENRLHGRSNHYYLTEEAMRIFDLMISRIPAATGHNVSPLSSPARGEGRVLEHPAVY